MGSYIIRRLLAFIPTLLVVSFLVFMMTRLVPGDAAAMMLGQEATTEQREQLRQELGLDRSVTEQAITWYGNAFRGDLGHSYFLHQPVTEALVSRLPVTLSVTLFAMFFAIVVGISAGVVASVRHGRFLDWGVMLIAIFGLSIPVFWLALNMIFIFSVRLGWFPTGGYVPITDGFFEYLRHLFMPSIALGLAYTALIARMTRSTMLEVLQQDFVRTARAKGLGQRIVILRHALRNALIPIITIIGISAGELLAGSVITETVFNLPGVGRLIVDGVRRRDFPVVQGGILIITLSYLLINLIADLLYAWANPRIRYE